MNPRNWSFGYIDLLSYPVTDKMILSVYEYNLTK